MKTTTSSFFKILLIAATVVMFIPSGVSAWSSHDKSYKGSSDKGSCDKGSKGSSDKGSKGSCDKGSKGSNDKGSKGSCDKGSKGSNDKGSKGSCDKGSKGSCDSSTPKVTTGTVCGAVYEDTNGNAVQDSTETGVANIQISITDINATVTSVFTDDIGNYCAENIVEGSTTIEVIISTLPTNALLTAGINPNDITVIADTLNDAQSDGYNIITF